MLFHQIADETEKRNESSQCRTDNVEVVDRQGRHGWPPNPERTLKIRRTAMSASSMALLNSRRSLTAKLNKCLLLLHEGLRDDRSGCNLLFLLQSDVRLLCRVVRSIRGVDVSVSVILGRSAITRHSDAKSLVVVTRGLVCTRKQQVVI